MACFQGVWLAAVAKHLHKNARGIAVHGEGLTIILQFAKPPRRPLWRVIAEYAVTIAAAVLASYLILQAKL